MTKQFTFELRRGFTLDDHFVATFYDARLRGDRLATRLGMGVTLYAYNEPLHKWDALGTFHGHMRFIDQFGDSHIIKNDFSGLVKARKEDEQ